MKMIDTERTHLFTPNIGIAINISISGNPGDELIKSAIAKAVNCHEALHSRIVLQRNGLAFYEKTKPNYQVHTGSDNWVKIVEDFPLHPLDIFNGEMVRFFILRRNGTLQLLMIGHHLAGDGMSFVFLAGDIMRLINGESVAYTPLQVVDVNTLPKASKIPVLIKFHLQRMNRQWKKRGHIFTESDQAQLLNEYAKNYNGSVFSHHFSPVETARLTQYAKTVGLSVNTLLVTALLKAYKKAAKVGIPISIRDTEYKGMANWVSGVTMHHQYDTGADYVTNAGAVQAQISKLLQSERKKHFVLRFVHQLDDTLLDAICLSKYLGYANPIAQRLASLMYYTDNLVDVGVTNLTRVMIPTSRGHFSIQKMDFVAPVVPYCKRVIGIVTFDKTMSMTMNTISSNKATEYDFFSRAVSYIGTLGLTKKGV